MGGKKGLLEKKSQSLTRKEEKNKMTLELKCFVEKMSRKDVHVMWGMIT